MAAEIIDAAVQHDLIISQTFGAALLHCCNCNTDDYRAEMKHSNKKKKYLFYNGSRFQLRMK